MPFPAQARALVLVLAAALTAGPALAETWRHDSSRDHVGRIYSYTRSNSDGSKPETIHVYRQSATRIVVNKAVSRCTTSALVTADLDLTTGQAARLTAGKLNRQGGQDAFGTITRDAGTGRLDLALGDVRQSLAVSDQPWMLYDFDLADLTNLLPYRQDPKTDFSFGMALVWPPEKPGDDPNKLLTYLGRADARFEGVGASQGRPAYVFRVTGPAFNGGREIIQIDDDDTPRVVEKTGRLWIDKAHGHVVAAQWPIPNHPGYKDYQLVVDTISDGGEAAWNALMADHWKGCPAA
jgi:hypothetical protein